MAITKTGNAFFRFMEHPAVTASMLLAPDAYDYTQGNASVGHVGGGLIGGLVGNEIGKRLREALVPFTDAAGKTIKRSSFGYAGEILSHGIPWAASYLGTEGAAKIGERFFTHKRQIPMRSISNMPRPVRTGLRILRHF